MKTYSDLNDEIRKKMSDVNKKLRSAKTDEERENLYNELMKIKLDKNISLIKTEADRKKIIKMREFKPNMKRQQRLSPYKIDHYNMYELRCYLIENGDLICKWIASQNFATRKNLVTFIMGKIPKAIELFNP